MSEPQATDSGSPEQAQPDPATEQPSPQPAKKLRTCACGHDRKHHMVSAEPEYTIGGWLLLLIGVSVRPIKLKYRCRQCDQVFDTSTDKKALLYHV